MFLIYSNNLNIKNQKSSKHLHVITKFKSKKLSYIQSLIYKIQVNIIHTNFLSISNNYYIHKILYIDIYIYTYDTYIHIYI